MDGILAKLVSDGGWTPGGVGIWVLVMLAATYLFREWREYRKLSIEDRNARREGYAKQIEDLMRENREQREDMRKLREEYDVHRRICQQETDQLREMIVKLEDEVQGLKRRVATDAIEILRMKGKEI